MSTIDQMAQCVILYRIHLHDCVHVWGKCVFLSDMPIALRITLLSLILGCCCKLTPK